MKKILLSFVILGAASAVLFSCYNNKADITSLPQVSFRSDVVPIVTGSPCGCHNNGSPTREVQFSHIDTIFYDAILARVSYFQKWVNGGSHPGGGIVDLTDREKTIFKAWIEQGAKDNSGGGCSVPTTVTYTNNFIPIYNTICSSSSCHGGLGPVLTYQRLLGDKDKLTAMMASAGASGHPGGVLSLGSCTVATIKAWIDQGQPQ